MPIKPENRHRYPADWPAVRASILTRARLRCEHPGCGAMQYALGTWVREPGGPWCWRPLEGNRPATTAFDNAFDNAGEGCDAYGVPWTYKQARLFLDHWFGPTDEDRPTIIVLTIAHLNHQPEDCRPENLRAMCQRHHLAYDAEHHRASAQLTRQRRRGMADLFEPLPTPCTLASEPAHKPGR
jgi:hypothetical protein